MCLGHEWSLQRWTVREFNGQEMKQGVRRHCKGDLRSDCWQCSMKCPTVWQARNCDPLLGKLIKQLMAKPCRLSCISLPEFQARFKEMRGDALRNSVNRHDTTRFGIFWGVGSWHEGATVRPQQSECSRRTASSVHCVACQPERTIYSRHIKLDTHFARQTMFRSINSAHFARRQVSGHDHSESTRRCALVSELASSCGVPVEQ